MFCSSESLQYLQCCVFFVFLNLLFFSLSGDFAVLLKAGMSTKQALTYNVVSSVLCLFGMIAGILVGNISNASYWVFCATAGLFLYISLVDMVGTEERLAPLSLLDT